MHTTLFYFPTIKIKSLATLTALIKVTIIKMKSLSTLNTLFYFTAVISVKENTQLY